MRACLFAALVFFIAPASAQETTAESDIARASRMLAANWRPLAEGPNAQAAFDAACAGAIEELQTLDAALPAELDPAALQTLRAERGLIIVPTTENPAAAYIFPNAQLARITSGLAAIRVLDTASGQVSLTDSAGLETRLQLGVAGGKAMMRVLVPDAEPLLYVGCVSTTG